MKILFLSLAVVALLALSMSVRSQNVASNGTDPAYLGKPWSTYGTKTDTSDLALQSAPGAGVRVFVTMAVCLNTSASTVQSATIKYSTTVIAVLNCPPGSKHQDPTYFDPPLPIPANTALTMQGTASVSTTYLFAQGTVGR